MSTPHIEHRGVEEVEYENIPFRVLDDNVVLQLHVAEVVENVLVSLMRNRDGVECEA
jgi:hypothetical protein